MELHVSNETNDPAKSYILTKMIEYNFRHFPDDLKDRFQIVNLYLKDANGNVYGGLVGEICWNWLEVQILFVDDAYRKLGYGKKLLLEAEQIAKDKKCDFIKLDTLSFQAVDFYKEQGYEIFGTIQNAGSHTHYYLKKDIHALR
ncbi:Acetyltransferase (GNAT) family protein [Paenibacillus sp. UNCCL117]|uniref:GNAT family N-acetyltransferase n=1 Tax=unclassified Paenibacillus TaxID=185978 RepID=UPI00087EF535|nr:MULTISPECIES: GNAT family N-acetyltransferase [unclassified Paenibacillus]SDD55272.1 Acetyltransferase (GNAT) family protein [Paenibacillus sp. cl123]SFW51622.1 Acetyltransferase (GNAT) family protein [Paenibacillus sp. UNCCL117]